MASRSESDRPRQIRSLTGIRGLCACYVMFYHLEGHTLPPGPARTFVEHGYLSVDLFFVLSGYVMSMMYFRWFEDGFAAPSYRRFLFRRAARIYPLYFVLTVLCAVVALTGRHRYLAPDEAPGVILANLAMIQGWGFAESLDGPAWSVSTETAAYLLFPLIVWASLRTPRALGLGLVSCACLALLAVLPEANWGLTRTNGPLDVGGGVWPLARCLAGFSLGVLAWIVARTSAFRGLAGQDWPALAVAAAMIALLFVPGSDLALLLLCPLLIALIATDQSSVARFLGRPGVWWHGEISYSIYLVHILMLSVKLRLIGTALWRAVPHANLVATAALCLMAIGFAAISYRAIERPGREAIQRWAEERRRRLMPAGATLIAERASKAPTLPASGK